MSHPLVSTDTGRYRQEAMAFIFGQMAFLLAQVGANSLMCRHDVGWFGTRHWLTFEDRWTAAECERRRAANATRG